MSNLFKNLSTHAGIWVFYPSEDSDGIMLKYLSDNVLGVWEGVWNVNGIQPDQFEWEHQGNIKFKKNELDIHNLDLQKAYQIAIKKGVLI